MAYYKKSINIIFDVSIIRHDMSVIYLLLSISILVAIAFFIIFVISTKRGQYDDMYTPSVRMLFDDELIKEKKKQTKQN